MIYARHHDAATQLGEEAIPFDEKERQGSDIRIPQTCSLLPSRFETNISIGSPGHIDGKLGARVMETYGRAMVRHLIEKPGGDNRDKFRGIEREKPNPGLAFVVDVSANVDFVERVQAGNWRQRHEMEAGYFK